MYKTGRFWMFICLILYLLLVTPFLKSKNSFQQVVEMAGFYFIAFDTDRNLDFLERKLHILNSIITWFIGPTLKFSPSSGDGRGYCKLCPEYNPAYPNAQKDAWFLGKTLSFNFQAFSQLSTAMRKN